MKVLLLFSLACAQNPASEPIARFLTKTEAADTGRYLERKVRASAGALEKRTKSKGIEQLLRERIAENLGSKKGFPLAKRELERTVIDFEIFKLESFVSSGVFPKRYFGYFDEKWDTAPYELTMRETIRSAVEISNALLKGKGSKTRITDLEIAITFISEGGALLLREDQESIESVHPVLGVGLDDIAIGFRQYRPLVEQLDKQLGTNLMTIVGYRNNNAHLVRMMTFKEAILGTVVMWVYEKEIAARKLKNKTKTELHSLPIDEQFIYASLVYNSGILFSKERVEMIRDFETASYLHRVSQKNKRKRWELPVFESKQSLRFLFQEGSYPEQPTSWSAVYHILQRYGGYRAIRHFTAVFDDNGRYRDRDNTP